MASFGEWSKRQREEVRDEADEKLGKAEHSVEEKRSEIEHDREKADNWRDEWNGEENF